MARRSPITRRFGIELLDALDKAYGRKAETYAWLQPTECFEVRHELMAHAEHAPALVFAAARQLRLLQAWLRSRKQGILSWRFTWHLDSRRDVPATQMLELHTAQPTQDIQHLERLLSEHLHQYSLLAPVHSISLCSLRSEPMPENTASLLHEEQSRGDPLHHFIERVAAKLGAQAIRRPVLQSDHRPEAAQTWCSATLAVPSQGKSGTRNAHPGQLPSGCPSWRPSWLLTQPVKLLTHNNRPHYLGPVTLLRDAERIEVSELAADCAGGAVTRDYFIAYSQHAHLLWIYRERPSNSGLSDPAWYLHGFFE